MAEDDHDKWNNDIPSSSPNCHAETLIVKWIYTQFLQLTYVRRERLMLARPTAEFPKHWFPIVWARERRKSAYIYIIPDWKCRALDSLLAWFDTILWRTLVLRRSNSHCNVQSYDSIWWGYQVGYISSKKEIRTFQLRLTWGSSDWGNRRSTDEINHSFSRARKHETNHGPPKFLFARDILPVEIKWHHPFPALGTSADPHVYVRYHTHIYRPKRQWMNRSKETGQRA